jgi:hypothetical protein
VVEARRKWWFWRLAVDGSSGFAGGLGTSGQGNSGGTGVVHRSTLMYKAGGGGGWCCRFRWTNPPSRVVMAVLGLIFNNFMDQTLHMLAVAVVVVVGTSLVSAQVAMVVLVVVEMAGNPATAGTTHSPVEVAAEVE